MTTKGNPIEVPQEWLETRSVLASHVPFYTEALNVIPLLAVDSGDHPAWTDGKSITLCPSVWEEIERNTLERGLPWFPTQACARAVLLLHELGHKVFRHHGRQGHRKLDLWRLACDFADNMFVVEILMMPPFNYRGDKLSKLEAAMAATGCYDKRFHGMTVEEIYEKLKEEQGNGGGGKQPQPQQQPQQGDGKQQGQGQPQPGGKGEGNGDKEEDDQQKPEQNQDDQKDDQKGNGDQDQNPQDDQDQDQGGNGEGGSDISDMFGDDFQDVPASGVPDDIGELIENALKDYAERNAQKLAGSGSGVGRELAEAAKKPPVRLEDVMKKLRDTVPQMDYGFRKIGKNDVWMMRRGMQVRMPAPSPSPSDKVRQMVFILDVSGSMSQQELKAANRIFLDAFKHVKNHQIRRLLVTEKVCENIVVKQSDGVPPIKYTGGTYLASVIDELEKDKVKPSVVILITDGYDSHESMKRMEAWKHVGKLRTILVRNPNGTYPGINFHCDEIESQCW